MLGEPVVVGTVEDVFPGDGRELEFGLGSARLRGRWLYGRHGCGVLRIEAEE